MFATNIKSASYPSINLIMDWWELKLYVKVIDSGTVSLDSN